MTFYACFSIKMPLVSIFRQRLLLINENPIFLTVSISDKSEKAIIDMTEGFKKE